MRLRQPWFIGLSLCVSLVLMSRPALAHHLMGGKLPATIMDGALSGLGHPIIGPDHLAAMLAVGCLAAAQRLGPALVFGYVLAQVAGAAVHVQGATVPLAELFVALSVVGLGTLVVVHPLRQSVTVALFALAGSFHGYALAESIVGAEPAPLAAYFAGLVVVQTGIALAAMSLVRGIVRRQGTSDPEPVRLAGAVIIGVGLAVMVQQIVPGT